MFKQIQVPIHIITNRLYIHNRILIKRADINSNIRTRLLRANCRVEFRSSTYTCQFETIKAKAILINSRRYTCRNVNKQLNRLIKIFTPFCQFAIDLQADFNKPLIARSSTESICNHCLTVLRHRSSDSMFRY